LIVDSGPRRGCVQGQSLLRLFGSRPTAVDRSPRKGRLASEGIGDKIETPFPRTSRRPDSERAIERMARSGCALVFTTSFGYMDATVAAAKKISEGQVRARTGLQIG